MVNITFFDTSNTLLDLFNGVRTNAPALPYFILGAAGLIIFLTNINEDMKKVFTLEGFILAIISALFVALKWVDVSIINFGVIMFVLGLFATFFMKKDV